MNSSQTSSPINRHLAIVAVTSKCARFAGRLLPGVQVPTLHTSASSTRFPVAHPRYLVHLPISHLLDRLFLTSLVERSDYLVQSLAFRRSQNTCTRPSPGRPHRNIRTTILISGKPAVYNGRIPKLCPTHISCQRVRSIRSPSKSGSSSRIEHPFRLWRLKACIILAPVSGLIHRLDTSHGLTM